VMHPIGTRIHCDGVKVGAYTTNSLVPKPVLLDFVQSMSIVGRHCFSPDVITVIQKLEADSGLVPVSPMDGNGHSRCMGFSIDMSVLLINDLIMVFEMLHQGSAGGPKQFRAQIKIGIS
jgi:hypothetical protein